MEVKLTQQDKDILEENITENEIKTAIFSAKNNKSPGEDGIISEFYKEYWYLIKDDFMGLIKEVFDNYELSETQNRGLISLLYKCGERENIGNWRPITLLNTDYKIISKILANRLKKVLPKIIHGDQKGFVPGRNIQNANRFIQDLIHYTDEENLEGAIIFLDQQKAFDRVEWGWVDACFEYFNFGENFRKWIKMLTLNAKTSIITNGYLSKFFPISRSARQGCPISPLLYIIQAEPMACHLRANNKIKGLTIPGNTVKEAKINMFADDTQLFHRTENSIKEGFKSIAKYEKASGSRINFKKTIGLYIGRWKNKIPVYTQISWTRNCVKTLGIYHGYNIDDNDIWRKLISKIKNCLHVWKTRNLSFEGKTLIIKSLIYSVIGYEIEIRGIPDIYMKEINTLVWNFLWDNKTNRIERNVCCLEKEEGGLGMVNLEMIINTKQINTIYKIIHSSEETWNSIGKYWLTKYDTNYDQSFFMCYCSNMKGLDINFMPLYYQKALETWSNFIGKCQSNAKQDIIEQNLFGNHNIVFKQKPLFFTSFAQSGIKKIKDILSDDNTRVKADGDIFNELHYKRNWISEWSKMKSAVKNIIQKLNDNEESNSKLIMNNLVFFGVKKTRVTKLKVKHIKYILLKGKTPKVQSKWNTEFNKDFDWKLLWRNLHNCPTASKIKDLQWKCAHNIIYTEYLLSKMGLSNGKCHFCVHHTETLDHLFFHCVKIQEFLNKIFTYMYQIIPGSHDF